MPMYDFKCESCGHEYEAIVYNSYGHVANQCPECGEFTGFRQKAVYQSSFRLKGTGWYKDGYSSAKS